VSWRDSNYPGILQGKPGVDPPGGAKSGALSAVSDPDLARVAEPWPELPEHIRETILVLIGKTATDLASRQTAVE
jgi:hypothetical protein